jgi:UDP-N-acetylglucosamine--N-acetylmuramyl-(pentapeptide) pyrophosphoryl-undecaprenol N-acetylglucosamine transferase
MSVIIVAGGTGGHINAALAIGERIDDEIKYYSGRRHLDYKLFKDKEVSHLWVRPLMVKNPIKLLSNTVINTISFIKLFFIFLFKRPRYAIGCGGYVCGPVLSAAFLLGIPCYIVEQNAVMGMTNRILAILARRIFVHFTETQGLGQAFESKKIVAGNPIRQSITYNDPKITEVTNILVFGGSLGAEQVNHVINKLAKNGYEKRISIKHQVGKGNLPSEKMATGKNIENYEIVEYIDDMAAAYNWSNVIISRAGASSVSELDIVQRPCILIPYPLATHNHQEKNANSFKKDASFFVGILDHKLSSDELYQKLVENLDEAMTHVADFGKEKQNMAVDIILKEIKNG